MNSLRLFGAKDIRIVNVARPKIKSNEVLLETKAAAICGTDIRMWQNGYGEVNEEHPLTLGHEFSGLIAEVGGGVVGFEKGMRIAVQPNIGCGLCYLCVDGRFHLCEKYRAFGINMDGAFAEYVRIPVDALVRGNLTVIPDNVSFEEAAVTEPLSCVYNGFTKCYVKPGDFALVVGAGPIGLMHLQLLHMAGATVFLHDISLERLHMSKQILPFITIYHGDELGTFIKEKTYGKGLDVAITACPVPKVQSDMLPLMNYGGRINFFGGIPKDKQPVAIDTNIVHYKELYLTGSTRSSVAQFRKTLEFVQQGLIDVKSIITHRYSLADAQMAFENVKKATGIKHVIVF